MISAMPAETVADIHQLLGRYCHILDARAWERLPEVFTPDAVLDATSLGLGTHHGVEAIATLWRSIPHPTAHHVSAIVVEHNGTGTVTILSKGIFAWPDGLSGGDYQDVAIHTRDGWRLQQRRYVRRWSLRDTR